MLTIKNLTIKDLKNHVLMEDFSFTLKEGDKVAIIGEEGNGKSTFLKAIYQPSMIESYTSISGTIDVTFPKIGYLAQQLPSCWDEWEGLQYILKNDVDDEIPWEAYNELEKLEKCCIQMKLPRTLLHSQQKIKTLSGGEKVKLQLLKLMVQDCDLYLLDEPTNDLDITTLEWLERFIKNLQVPVLFISHDETLLQACANRIIHFEQLNKKSKCRIQDVKSSYQEYVSSRNLGLAKATQLARKEKQEYEKKKEKLNDIMNAVHDAQNSISRQDPHHARLLKKKMRAVKAMDRRFDQAGYAHVDSVEEAIDVYFEDINAIASKVILDQSFEVVINKRVLCKPYHLQLYGKDKVVIVGENGCGKSLFMKQVHASLVTRDDIRLGYMPQNYMDTMEKDMTPTTFLLTKGDHKDVSYSRELLGRMKFTSEEMGQPLAMLSEGQKAKLFLLRFIKTKCNVLLLDEPTRNLSPLSAPIIRLILQEYDGCILAISHDRYFIQEVANRTLAMKEQTLQEDVV